MNVNSIDSISVNSSTRLNQAERSPLLSLPLPQVLTILSFFDSISDLARVTRTCRLLHYMAMPQLYSCVVLKAHPDIQYIKGRPTGLGNASPFAAGLSTLATRDVTRLVRRFELCGEFMEHDAVECARSGRVPDSSFMLNTLVRVAVDRMLDLESFTWELNVKLFSTVYEGLASRKLKSLTIQMPSTRTPQPTITIPPLPALESLKVTQIDPLCFPDDISVVLLHAHKLTELCLAWSPRMRLENDPSVDLNAYFGRTMRSGRKLKMKSLTLKHLYCRLNVDLLEIFDVSELEIGQFFWRAAESEPGHANVFLDMSWNPVGVHVPHLKVLRQDDISLKFLSCFRHMIGLESLYFVNPANAAGSSNISLSPSNVYMFDASTSGYNAGDVSKNDFLEIIFQNGGQLRHLCLPHTWSLDTNDIVNLAENCRALEQLSFGPVQDKGRTLQLVLQSFPKLRAMRLNYDLPETCADSAEAHFSDLITLKVFQTTIQRSGQRSIKWLQLGKHYLHCSYHTESGSSAEPVLKANVTRIGYEDFQDIEIFAMDSYNV